MADAVIQVDRLGKRYRIGAVRKRAATRAGRLGQALGAPLRYIASTLRAPDEEETLWALRDVSFEVAHGEVLGVIGRNGAGKSTLLKILSRITDPTEGCARIRGPVGSLLEVGTGFHPELTGRENIYLNGAVLGMTRAEIHGKFDEIVAFAEIDRFIDTPVKRYSSGMYVRLAFAVAAHLEPEILLVDEVLAVGDAAFQKKCLGKMGDVAHEGRTILFVSHNITSVSHLCTKCLVLESGRVLCNDATEVAVDRYLGTANATQWPKDLTSGVSRTGKGRVRFVRLWLEEDDGRTIEGAITGRPVCVAARYEAMDDADLPNSRCSVGIEDALGRPLIVCSTELFTDRPVNLPPSGVVRCRIPSLPLSKGHYRVVLFLEINREVQDWISPAGVFQVAGGDFFDTGVQCPAGHEGKYVLVRHTWEFSEE